MATLHVASSSSGHRSQSANAIVGSHYRAGKKIGEGSFGVVFEGTNLITKQPVAIKFEPRKSATPQLRNEFRSYRTLNGTVGVPQVHHFGQEGLHNVLVIDLLGPNLEDLFDRCGRKFTIKTVCMVAKQMITRVQSVHDKSLIHRAIVPDNLLIAIPGTKNASVIHIIDFGVAKHYRDPKTKVHIPYRERKSLSGTAWYMSINTHLGREQSRRDDLESLGYVFMYFLRGVLPWQGLRAATNKQKYEKIGEKKQATPIAELCEGFPEEFGIYMNYVRKLGFEEEPDYDFLRELFTRVLKNIGEPDDGIFDWMLLNKVSPDDIIITVIGPTGEHQPLQIQGEIVEEGKPTGLIMEPKYVSPSHSSPSVSVNSTSSSMDVSLASENSEDDHRCEEHSMGSYLSAPSSSSSEKPSATPPGQAQGNSLITQTPSTPAEDPTLLPSSQSQEGDGVALPQNIEASCEDKDRVPKRKGRLLSRILRIRRRQPEEQELQHGRLTLAAGATPNDLEIVPYDEEDLTGSRGFLNKCCYCTW